MFFTTNPILKTKKKAKRVLFRFVCNNQTQDQENDFSDEYIFGSLSQFFSFIKHRISEFSEEECLFVPVTENESDIEITKNAYFLYSFLKFYTENKRRLDNAITDYNKNIMTEDNDYVREMVRAFAKSNSGGKLIRGTLVNMGYALSGCSDIYISDNLAISYELFQTSILIHDDIIDHAKTRRGKPTIPYTYLKSWEDKGIKQNDDMADTANSMAICLGDLGLSFSIKHLIDSYHDSPYYYELLSFYVDSFIHTVYGEAIDVILPFEEKNGLNRGNSLIDDITMIYILKTSWYTFISPLTLGYILGKGKDNNIDKLKVLGTYLGVAFQIKDDILGVFSTNEDMGKDIGSDISEYKQTYLYAYTLQNKEYGQELKSIYGNKNLDYNLLQQVREIFKESGALKASTQLMEEYFEKAKDLIVDMDFLSNCDKERLLGLIVYLGLREK